MSSFGKGRCSSLRLGGSVKSPPRHTPPPVAVDHSEDPHAYPCANPRWVRFSTSRSLVLRSRQASASPVYDTSLSLLVLCLLASPVGPLVTDITLAPYLRAMPLLPLVLSRAMYRPRCSTGGQSTSRQVSVTKLEGRDRRRSLMRRITPAPPPSGGPVGPNSYDVARSRPGCEVGTDVLPLVLSASVPRVGSPLPRATLHTRSDTNAPPLVPPTSRSAPSPPPPPSHSDTHMEQSLSTQPSPSPFGSAAPPLSSPLLPNVCDSTPTLHQTPDLPSHPLQSRPNTQPPSCPSPLLSPTDPPHHTHTSPSPPIIQLPSPLPTPQFKRASELRHPRWLTPPRPSVTPPLPLPPSSHESLHLSHRPSVPLPHISHPASSSPHLLSHSRLNAPHLALSLPPPPSSARPVSSFS
ncbi:hypothetical protein C7M84_002773 [Penaeus vannamei]|uniref:Uncharacterized protein n=1 Tax=Penaeus vannamei TaxID=6689 RepID=A0A3R7SWF2_PENVA|nr:hypothetical protein C7M84_002773 [Penaeus vannamei]